MLILLSCYVYKFHVKGWLIKVGIIKPQHELAVALQPADYERNAMLQRFESSTMCN